MKIVLSEHAGFCFGVRRAVELLEKELTEGDHRVYTLGHIIHNEDFNANLEKRGVVCVNENDLDSIPKDGTLVFVRTHGISRKIQKRLEASGLPFIDATCPFVKKIHEIVLKEEADAAAKGEEIVFVLLGDRVHPEVLGIVSCAERYPVVVIPSAEELLKYEKNAPKERRHIFLSQTTHSVEEWERCCEVARRAFSNLSLSEKNL